MGSESQKKSKFTLVGMVISIEFQRARFYIERLCKSLPRQYENDIRPLLNLDWHLYLTEIRRKFGGKIWALKKNVVAFLDDTYLGDDDAVFAYMQKYIKIRTAVDFYVLGVHQIKSLLSKSIEDGRKFAYFSIMISGIVVGSMMFMLYQELVPKASELFLKRCESSRHGWRDRKIHRIVNQCWIQGGGFKLSNKHLACENYVIPHDRRGVLSLCNGGKHTDNNIQFIISLNPTPWMDYKYVAFGQLIQGEETLRKIEAINTRYESPKEDIVIVSCGEYKLDLEIDEREIGEVVKYYQTVDEDTDFPEDVEHPDDVASEISERRYRRGEYCMDNDMKSNLDTMQLPDYLVRLYMEYTGVQADDEEGMDYDYTQDVELVPITESEKYKDSLKLSDRLKMSTRGGDTADDDDDDIVADTEIVQKVIEFDEIPTIVEAAKETSSEIIDQEEQKRMFV